jgi:predicted permease
MRYQRFKFAVLCFLRRKQADRELEEEIRAHLEMAEQERRDRGETSREAKQNARRELGNELLIKETTRDMWGWTYLERFAHDMSQVLRQIRRSPVFTTTAVFTLALGLGGTTAMFSIVNGVLLRPLPFRDPGRLYLARTLPPKRSKLTGDFPVNARHFHEWRTHCRSCESVSLVRYDEMTLVGAGNPVVLPTYSVSSNFFKTLGVQPSLGRDFLPEEDRPGHWGEVILTDALWRSRFGGDPSIIGRTAQLNGETWTVVGVMPPGVHLPKGDEWGSLFGPQTAPLIFRPILVDPSRASPVGGMNYSAVVHLNPRVRREQAMAELNALLADFVQTYKIENTTTLIPLEQQVIRRARSALWLLLGAVGAVLLIACVNVGNLMLVRTTGRHREAGVRMALGASRGQLFGLVLKESLVLVAVGGGIGLALATVGLKWLAASAPISLPRIEEVQIDWRVFSFAAVATGFATIACGLFPAWRLSHTEPLEAIKAGSAGSTESPARFRLRDALVSVEVALSTVLLIIGGLLMLSFLRVMRVEKGFEVAHIITQDVSFLNPKYRGDAPTRFLDEALRKLGHVPGVEYAAAVNQLPLLGEDWVSDLQDPDQPTHSVENAALANFRFVTPDYWRAMGIPLKEGRFLDESDRNRSKALISERAAQYLWPKQNPIGKHVLGAMKGRQQSPSLEVVGVVGEVRAAGLEQTSPTMMVYEDYSRMKPLGMSLVVRTHTNPTPIAAAVRAILSSADPEMAISQARTMEQILGESVAQRKFQMDLAVGFAIASLALASLGIYGVISFAVARRTPEIGIRIALGARGRQVVAMEMWRGILPVVAGIAAGLVCALSIGRFLASQLFGVGPHDAVTILIVLIVLLAVAICACWAPAHRAARIDPIRALRFE